MEHTTNEQKAKEIAEKTHTVWRDEEGEVISSQDDCYEAAIAMAKWKDRQFTELINALPTPLKELIKAFAYSESSTENE